MRNNFGEYSHIKVILSEVLDELEGFEKEMTRSLLRVDKEATEDSAKQLIGQIQGVHKARTKLEVTFGAV